MSPVESAKWHAHKAIGVVIGFNNIRAWKKGIVSNSQCFLPAKSSNGIKIRDGKNITSKSNRHFADFLNGSSTFSVGVPAHEGVL